VDNNVWPADIREEEPSEVLLPNYPYVEERLIDDPSKVNSDLNARNLRLVFKCTYERASGKQYGYEQKYDLKREGGFTAVKGTATCA